MESVDEQSLSSEIERDLNEVIIDNVYSIVKKSFLTDILLLVYLCSYMTVSKACGRVPWVPSRTTRKC